MVAAGEGPGVHGGGADAETGGWAVEDDAAGVGGGVAEEGLEGGFVFFGEDGVGEGVDGWEGFAWGLGENGGVGAEGFFDEFGVEWGVVEGVEGGCDGVHAVAAGCARGECADAGQGGEFLRARTEGLGGPWSDERAGLGSGEGVRHGAFEAVRERSVGCQQDDEPRLGALLTGAGEDALREGLGDGLGASLQRVVRDEDGVDAAHLGVDGDGVRAGAGEGVEGGAGGEGTCKSHGGDVLVCDEGVGESVIVRVGWGAEVLEPVLAGVAGVEFLKGGAGEGEDQAACVWVGGVFFDDDGATGGEGGGGVAAEGAVGEGEVAGGEDGDGPDGDEVGGEVVVGADGLVGGLGGRAVGGGEEGVGS